MKTNELKAFLDLKSEQYNSADFIKDDPISVPHQFEKKRDIEFSGLLMATIAWGNRKSILNSGAKLMDIMGHAPYDFVVNHQPADLKICKDFVHRTFNEEDLRYFFHALQQIWSAQTDTKTCERPIKKLSSKTPQYDAPVVCAARQ